MALQVITPPMTDTALRDLRRRTAARLMASRVEMRTGWLLHPDNAVRRASAFAEHTQRHIEAMLSNGLYTLEGFKALHAGVELRP